MKIKSKNCSGCKLTVPFDGTITIDANGYVDVSDKCANALVNGTHDWEYVTNDAPAADNGSKELDEDAQVVAGIKAMELDAMIELATESGYDESEWRKLAKNAKNGKKLMAAYLIKKYNEAKLAEETESGDEEDAEAPNDAPAADNVSEGEGEK